MCLAITNDCSCADAHQSPLQAARYVLHTSVFVCGASSFTCHLELCAVLRGFQCLSGIPALFSYRADALAAVLQIRFDDCRQCRRCCIHGFTPSVTILGTGYIRETQCPPVSVINHIVFHCNALSEYASAHEHGDCKTQRLISLISSTESRYTNTSGLVDYPYNQ